MSLVIWPVVPILLKDNVVAVHQLSLLTASKSILILSLVRPLEQLLLSSDANTEFKLSKMLEGDLTPADLRALPPASVRKMHTQITKLAMDVIPIPDQVPSTLEAPLNVGPCSAFSVISFSTGNCVHHMGSTFECH